MLLKSFFIVIIWVLQPIKTFITFELLQSLDVRKMEIT